MEAATDLKKTEKIAYENNKLHKRLCRQVGQAIGEVLAAARRQSVEVVFFTADGERSDTQPAEGGSVSVFTVAKNGQDNYTFDDAGRVTRHQRSVGENFARGVWEEVR